MEQLLPHSAFHHNYWLLAYQYLLAVSRVPRAKFDSTLPVSAASGAATTDQGSWAADMGSTIHTLMHYEQLEVHYLGQSHVRMQIKQRIKLPAFQKYEPYPSVCETVTDKNSYSSYLPLSANQLFLKMSLYLLKEFVVRSCKSCSHAVARATPQGQHKSLLKEIIMQNVYICRAPVSFCRIQTGYPIYRQCYFVNS